MKISAAEKRGLCLIFALTVMVFTSQMALAGGSDPYGNEDPNKKILKQGLLGAGTGAIASGASGGDAGKGALIGAGTNIIGGALLDTLTAPSQPQQQPAYYPPQQGYAPQPQGYAPQPQGYAPAPQTYQQQPAYGQQPRSGGTQLAHGLREARANGGRTLEISWPCRPGA